MQKHGETVSYSSFSLHLFHLQLSSHYRVVAGSLVATMISRRLVIIGLITTVIGVNFLPDTIIDRIQTIVNPQADSSSAFRLQIWKAALPMIKDYWLTGIGSDLTTFKKVYADYMMPGVCANHLHSIYLINFVTEGIVVILLLLYMFYQSLWT
jgi:putative inorganic carbon (HCO3(-)) transporter